MSASPQAASRGGDLPHDRVGAQQSYFQPTSKRDASSVNDSRRLTRGALYVVCGLIGGLVSACGSSDSTSSAAGSRGERSQNVALPVDSFSDAFILRRRVTLQQPESLPIVRISGLGVTDDGRFLLADASEAHVIVYDSMGTVLDVIGRKGDGPGEFREPRYPAIDSGGTIFVGEGGARMSTFTSDGNPISQFRFDSTSFLGAVQRTSSGTFILTDHSGLGYSVAEFDSAGHRLRNLWHRDTLPVSPNPEDPAWRSIGMFYLGLLGDTVVVNSTVSDSLWFVPIDGGTTTALHLELPGYVAPSLPSPEELASAHRFTWANKFHRPVAPRIGDGFILVPFIQGILNYGDPSVVAFRGPQGEWRELVGAPPILTASGHEAIGLLTPNQAEVTLGVYELSGVESSP